MLSNDIISTGIIKLVPKHSPIIWPKLPKSTSNIPFTIANDFGNVLVGSTPLPTYMHIQKGPYHTYHVHENISDHDHGGLVVIPCCIQSVQKVIVERSNHIFTDLKETHVSKFMYLQGLQSYRARLAIAPPITLLRRWKIWQVLFGLIEINEFPAI